MGLFGTKKHDVIHVQFFDRATGKMFADSRMPVAQLPESFEASTTLHLAGGDWSVAEARPITAAEFRRTGKLVLILDKITKGVFDASTILFSLPTITNDALPPIATGSSKLGVDVIEIHEDHWRQIEWLPASAMDTVEAELASIRRIYEEERLGQAFRKCHLRCSVPMLPYEQPMRFEEFRAAIGLKATWLAGFAYQGVAGIVANSFAVGLISSVEIFGVARNGVIESVCFANTRANNVPDPDVKNLAALAARHDLLLVDWCGTVAIPPNHEDYLAYFVGTGN